MLTNVVQISYFPRIEAAIATAVYSLYLGLCKCVFSDEFFDLFLECSKDQ